MIINRRYYTNISHLVKCCYQVLWQEAGVSYFSKSGVLPFLAILNVTLSQ